MKKTLILTLAIALVLGNAFFLFEGAVALAGTVTSTSHTTGTGNTISLDYPVELTVDPEMDLTCETSTPVSMTGSINGMTGGSATGNRSCDARTNNDVGYTMQAVVTGMTDVLTGAHTFTAYSGATSTWAAPTSGNNKFGLSTTLTGWIAGTSATTIASSPVHTATNGTADSVTVNYRADVAAGSVWPSGLYRATTTISLYMN